MEEKNLLKVVISALTLNHIPYIMRSLKKLQGIDEGAPERAIKKSYRALSLKYHPDKNPGNKMAEDMFLKITQAYQALTVPQARENWQKYGNPDGKQPMEVSIALPTFLLDKNWHNVILIVYLIAMVVVIPAIVAVWYNQSKKYVVTWHGYSFFYFMLPTTQLTCERTCVCMVLIFMYTLLCHVGTGIRTSCMLATHGTTTCSLTRQVVHVIVCKLNHNI